MYWVQCSPVNRRPCTYGQCAGAFNPARSESDLPLTFVSAVEDKQVDDITRIHEETRLGLINCFVSFEKYILSWVPFVRLEFETLRVNANFFPRLFNPDNTELKPYTQEH